MIHAGEAVASSRYLYSTAIPLPDSSLDRHTILMLDMIGIALGEGFTWEQKATQLR